MLNLKNEICFELSLMSMPLVPFIPIIKALFSSGREEICLPVLDHAEESTLKRIADYSDKS